MKTIYYSNKISLHLVTILTRAPFTPKSSSKLRSALHAIYTIVIPCFVPIVSLILSEPQPEDPWCSYGHHLKFQCPL